MSPVEGQAPSSVVELGVVHAVSHFMGALKAVKKEASIAGG
jgi:hypothetical protein